MRTRLTREFRFEASHRLEHLAPDHPCFNLHGHSYKVEIEVAGEVNPTTGFLIDYADLKRVVAPVIQRLDHHHLNDVRGLTITSAEFIAEWLWREIKPHLPILSRVSIQETDRTRCDYFGE